MRWSVKTSVKDEQVSATKTKRTKTTTRTQYITVGDIVGSAKSVSGAVKNIVRKVPSYRDAFRLNGDTASANLAQTCLNIATPLSAIITGAEIYKSVMNVVNILTPIFKLIARGTGVWCSPGNIADIANIVLGTVQQILIAIVTQIIIALKEWVFSFEFKLRELTESSSRLITKNLKNAAGKINKAVSESLNSNTLNPSMSAGTSESNTYRQELLNEYYNELNEIAGSSELPDDLAKKISEAFKQQENPTKEKLFGNAWMTITPLSNGMMREFRGSVNDCGIQYSDIEDGKVVWKDSLKTDGCFCSFGKLKKEDGKVIYVAGSMPYIKGENLEIPEEEDYNISSRGQYNKDYYTYKSKNDLKEKNNNFKKLTKREKDEKDLSTRVFNTSTKCFVPDSNIQQAIGIWYSLDDGINWTQSSNVKDRHIGNFFDYKKTDEYPETLVAADYDYEGLLYSIDGSDWERAKINGEDFDYGRFVSLYDVDNSKVRTQAKINAVSKITATVGVLTRVEEQNITSKATLSFNTEISNEKFLLKRKVILDYIHSNYHNYNGDEYYLNKFDNSFWKQLLTDIDNNVYTLENAKKGDRIINE